MVSIRHIIWKVINKYAGNKNKVNRIKDIFVDKNVAQEKEKKCYLIYFQSATQLNIDKKSDITNT